MTITDEAPSAAVTAFLARRSLDAPVFFDVRGEAAEAFGSRATPHYLVTDGAGTIVFDDATLDQAARQAAVLAGRRPRHR